MDEERRRIEYEGGWYAEESSKRVGRAARLPVNRAFKLVGRPTNQRATSVTTGWLEWPTTSAANIVSSFFLLLLLLLLLLPSSVNVTSLPRKETR